MNGPEHYKEAESLLALSWETHDLDRSTAYAVQAQAHAALAGVAALVESLPGNTPPEAWRSVLTPEAPATNPEPTTPPDVALCIGMVGCRGDVHAWPCDFWQGWTK